MLKSIFLRQHIQLLIYTFYMHILGSDLTYIVLGIALLQNLLVA